MPNIIYTVAERVEMVRQYEQGLSFRRIVDHFAATYPDRPIPSKSTVQKIVKTFRETGNLDPSLIKITQPKKQLSDEIKLNICLAVEEGSKKPLSQIARELQISKSTVHRIVQSHKNRRKPYKLRDTKKKAIPAPEEDQSQSVSEGVFDSVLERVSDSASEKVSDAISEKISDLVFVKVSERVSDSVSQKISERVSDSISEEVSDPVSFEKVFDSVSERVYVASPLHYSLWSYLRNKLRSEGRSEDLDILWNRVTNVLESLDKEVISKINNSLDIDSPLIKEELICENRFEELS